MKLNGVFFYEPSDRAVRWENSYVVSALKDARIGEKIASDLNAVCDRWYQRKAGRKAPLERALEGKTIQGVKFQYDGGQLHSLSLEFTDGAAACISFCHQPSAELIVYDRYSDDSDIGKRRQLGRGAA